MKKNKHSPELEDLIYLKEDRRDRPKDYFSFIVEKLSSVLGSNPEICDVGCAAGDFLYFLKKKYPGAKLSGIDLQPKSIERAKQHNPGVDFKVGDILDKNTLPEKKFDVVFMNGVHNFHDFRPVFKNLLSLVKIGGTLAVFQIFNPCGVDTRISTHKFEDNIWQPEWTLLSKQSAQKILEHKRIKFYDFKLKRIIKRRKNDPLRSWTIDLKNGGNIIMNGAGIVYFLSLLVVKN